MGTSPSYKCKLSLSTCCWLWLICTWTKVWIKWQNNGYMSYLFTVTPLNMCKLLPKRFFQKIVPIIIQINWFFITMIGYAIFHIIFVHVFNNKPTCLANFIFSSCATRPTYTSSMNIAFINGKAIWSLCTTRLWVKMEPPKRYVGIIGVWILLKWYIPFRP